VHARLSGGPAVGWSLLHDCLQVCIEIDVLPACFAAKGSGAFLRQEDEEDSDEEKDVYYNDDE
jgi:hypothetical protein